MTFESPYEFAEDWVEMPDFVRPGAWVQLIEDKRARCGIYGPFQVDEQLPYRVKGETSWRIRSVPEYAISFAIDELQPAEAPPGSLEHAQKSLNQLETELELLRRDKARLDFLQRQSSYRPWVARASTTGRGYRLHTTSRGEEEGARADVREAIDVAMQAGQSA